VEGHYDRLPPQAADLVTRPVAILVMAGGVSALAAKAATSTIPIVFLGSREAVELASLSALVDMAVTPRASASLTSSWRRSG
jgi:ABC-type uncharacterized transport system substrate-binding protein